ncbi:MAG TPA: acyl-CoA dehydrogenase family protein [Candidatus Binatia bacterium]|jgi:alkylation response protein AidB-like acyl-CoA dehydrogenase
MSAATPSEHGLIDAVGRVAPAARARADETERGRRLPLDLVGALAETGVFRACVPRNVGGVEADPADLVRAIEILAEADGAAGWVAMIGATSGLVAGYLEPETARHIYGDPRGIAGGVYAPSGKAAPVDGGYRVSGRWAFGSGCEHCTWLMGGSVIVENGAPRLLPNGLLDAPLMLFPAADAEIIDTWTVSGLRGTGSHDIAVRDLLVPAERAVSLVRDRPRERGPLYAFPAFGLLALGIAAVAVGIARRAIDELIALAGGKTPTGSRRVLADRQVVQAQTSEAEALLRSGRAFLFEAIGAASEEARREGGIGTRARLAVRLAATNATHSAAKAVDLMYTAGGGTAVYATSPLQRCFRDVHVVTQHLMVAPATYELTGRVLLGLDTDTSQL